MALATAPQPATDAERTIQQRIDDDVDARSDAFLLIESYQVEKLAQDAFDCFGTDRSQMRKLERMALSAGTYAEILNYVKSQAGRDTRTGREWRNRDFAYNLHDQLEAIRSEAEGRADTIIDGIERSLVMGIQREEETKSDTEKRIDNWVTHEMRLRFVQRYIRHLAAEYIFLVSQKESRSY